MIQWYNSTRLDQLTALGSRSKFTGAMPSEEYRGIDGKHGR
jgi:hypothetical protein